MLCYDASFQRGVLAKSAQAKVGSQEVSTVRPILLVFLFLPALAQEPLFVDDVHIATVLTQAVDSARKEEAPLFPDCLSALLPRPELPAAVAPKTKLLSWDEAYLELLPSTFVISGG